MEIQNPSQLRESRTNPKCKVKRIDKLQPVQVIATMTFLCQILCLVLSHEKLEPARLLAPTFGCNGDFGTTHV
jgi:hypothetical protein